MNEFLHNLLDVMIEQHGADKVKQKLTQLHAEMDVASLPESVSAVARECNRCGGDRPPGLIHYCM